MNAPQALVRWHDRGTSRIPFWAYTDPDLYQRELERLFYGQHWSYVGLAIEIPNTGDYKLSWVGERQVIMVRDRVAPKDRATDHGIRVVENRCAHRGRVVQAARQEGAVAVDQRHHVPVGQAQGGELAGHEIAGHHEVDDAVEAAVAQHRPAHREGPAVDQPRTHGLAHQQPDSAVPQGDEGVAIGDADHAGALRAGLGIAMPLQPRHAGQAGSRDSGI